MKIGTEMPKGWNHIKLKDITLEKDGLRRGPFGSAIKKEFFVPSGYKVYEQGNAIYDDPIRGNYYIDEKKYLELKHFEVIPNDLIVSCSGTLGRISAIPNTAQPGVINQALLRLRLNLNLISNKFFIIYFRSAFFQREIFDQSQGTAMTNLIGIKDLKEIKILIPPLPEQHRIVAKIEELLSSLDKGIETLKTAQQQLKVYRQAVLKWAFEGKLTNENAVDAVLPKGWNYKKIIELIQTLDQGWSPKCENRSSHSDDEWAVIKTTAIQAGYFVESENKVLPISLEPRKQHELRSGDVLITRAGPRSRAGVCCMIKRVRPKLINCDKVYRIRVKNEVIVPSYFALTLNSPDYANIIEEMKTGINDSGVNLTQKGFLQISIKLPPIKEQHAIVAEIESRLSVCDKIEESIDHSLKQAESLRQSILKKAFEGKLVSQDPNDEPASVLLDRIKAERERNKPEVHQPRKTGRTKKSIDASLAKAIKETGE